MLKTIITATLSIGITAGMLVGWTTLFHATEYRQATANRAVAMPTAMDDLMARRAAAEGRVLYREALAEMQARIAERADWNQNR